MKFALLAFVALSLSIPAMPKTKPHEWRTCKILKQEMVTYAGRGAVIPVAGMVLASPLRRMTNQVVVESAGYQYTLIEKSSRHYVALPEGGDGQFYQDGVWFVFLDSAGKEHKFYASHVEKLNS